MPDEEGIEEKVKVKEKKEESGNDEEIVIPKELQIQKRI